MSSNKRIKCTTPTEKDRDSDYKDKGREKATTETTSTMVDITMQQLKVTAVMGDIAATLGMCSPLLLLLFSLHSQIRIPVCQLLNLSSMVLGSVRG